MAKIQIKNEKTIILKKKVNERVFLSIYHGKLLRVVFKFG